MSLKKIHQKEFDLIKEECGILITKPSDIDKLDEDTFNHLYDVMVRIEEDDEYTTERGITASDVVTYMLPRYRQIHGSELEEELT